VVLVPIHQWVHPTGTVVAALVLPIPTPLDHEHLPGAWAERPILTPAMPVHHLGTHHLALRTRTQMGAKRPRGTHLRGHRTLMLMVERRQLGMRTQERRILMLVVEVVEVLAERQDGVERLLAGQRLSGEVRRRGGQVDGVAAIVGVLILGYVNF
jgi:hypothetical protein